MTDPAPPTVSGATMSGATVSRSVDIDAPADVVWGLVSDLPRMGELSPENTGGTWQGGATGPATGARFRGSNRHGWRRWSTTVQVTACEPGRRFAFDVTSGGLSVATWSYDVAERPGGCTLTETWEDRRGRAMNVVGRLATGVPHDVDGTAAGMERTLAAVRTRAEAVRIRPGPVV